MRANKWDVELGYDAALRGGRGNLAAAWAGAYASLEGSVRDAVLRRIETTAAACPVVEAGRAGSSSFVWLDGSRRRRAAV